MKYILFKFSILGLWNQCYFCNCKGNILSSFIYWYISTITWTCRHIWWYLIKQRPKYVKRQKMNMSLDIDLRKWLPMILINIEISHLLLCVYVDSSTKSVWIRSINIFSWSLNSIFVEYEDIVTHRLRAAHFPCGSRCKR